MSVLWWCDITMSDNEDNINSEYKPIESDEESFKSKLSDKWIFNIESETIIGDE